MGSTRQTFSEDRQAHSQPSPAPDSFDNPFLLIWWSAKQTNKQKIFGQSLNLAICYIPTFDIKNKEIRWKLGRNIDFVQLIFLQLFSIFISLSSRNCLLLSFNQNLSSFIFWRVLEIWILSWIMGSGSQSGVQQLKLVKAILSYADEDTQTVLCIFLTYES